MIKFLAIIPLYKFFRRFRFPKLLPFNITVSPTFKCNSLCRTCKVYQRKSVELSKLEWARIFKSLGRSVNWITFSGGEPFLKKDIVDIVKSAYEQCHPPVINIPTNGLRHKIIPEKINQIAQQCPKSQIIINISIDEIGEKHDLIRGVKNSYASALLTLEKIKNLRCPNITIGIHTVLSKFNCVRFSEIFKSIQKLHPDSYITEIAEERVELNTIGVDITPPADDYFRAINFLMSQMKRQKFKGIARITQAFRFQYYEFVKQTLTEHRQIIPCYAGFASAHIIPNGDVWMCCIKGEVIGNLKEVDFDFKKVWFSEKAEKIRKKIVNKECYCPLANAAYTNMLFNWSALFKVGMNLLRNHF